MFANDHILPTVFPEKILHAHMHVDGQVFVDLHFRAFGMSAYMPTAPLYRVTRMCFKQSADSIFSEIRAVEILFLYIKITLYSD
jgi:hypothetical protein